MAHRQPEYSIHPGTDLGDGDVLHRCFDGGTPGREGLSGHRTGGDDGLADGRTGFGGEHGILRAGGAFHRGERHGGGAKGAQAVDCLLYHLGTRHLHHGTLHLALPALLAGRQ